MIFMIKIPEMNSYKQGQKGNKHGYIYPYQHT